MCIFGKIHANWNYNSKMLLYLNYNNVSYKECCRNK